MRTQGRKYVWLSEQTHYSRTHLNDMLRGRSPLSPKFVKLAYTALGIAEEPVVA